MNTLYVGKLLLKILSEERGEEIKPHDFFEEEFWPVMFNSPDIKHLMQVHGSDFFQPSYPRLADKAGKPLTEFRKEKYKENLKATAAGKKLPTGNIGVGFMAGGPQETTFGQVTDLPMQFSEEELLYTWFGGALGIGFGGGFDFLTTEPELINFIYKGWFYYRTLLEETPNLKGRQIETWNGLWLLHGLEHRDNPVNGYDALSQELSETLDTSKNVVSLERPPWSSQVLEIARVFGGDTPLTLQGYSFGSTNKTLGFLQVKIPMVRKFSQLFDHLISQDTSVKSQILKDVFKAHYSMGRAAQHGSLGLKSLTPKNLPEHLGHNAPSLDKTKKTFKKDPYQFIIYKSWIIAMLNNEELHELAEELAKQLLAYKSKGTDSFSTMADKGKNIESLWERRYPSHFIHRISDIVNDGVDAKPVFKKATEAVSKQMTSEQFQLFQSLLRFEYIFLTRQENEKVT